MKVIYGIGQVKRLQDTVVAIGVFDGIHIGHQFLLRRVVDRAKEIKGTSVVVTFYPHPSHILNPKRELNLLISLKERLRLLSLLGPDICIVINFSRQFSRTKPEDFIRRHIVSRLNPREIFIGQGFTFGRNRGGEVELLQRLGRNSGFRVRIVKPLRVAGKAVSSTLVRDLIKNDQIAEAARLLKRPLSVRGKVIKGTGVGKKFGFPTANIRDCEGMLPSSGVYAARVIYAGKRFFGMAYIGRRPSFITQDRSQSIEVHIFNLRKSIYGSTIEVVFLKKIRKEKRFPNAASLIAQLRKDYQVSKKIIRNYSSPF